MKQCKYISIIIIILVLSWSVNGQSIANPYKRNTGAFQYDKGVNGIWLYEAKTVTSKLGKNVWQQHEFAPNEGYPRIECLSKDQKQILRLFFMEGGYENEPAGFQILQKPLGYKNPTKVKLVDIAIFKSQRGIVLGMAKNEVVKLLGMGFDSRKEKSGMETITYYTNKQEDHVFKEYNGVGYSIIAVFKNNKLIDYSFGFEYP